MNDSQRGKWSARSEGRLRNAVEEVEHVAAATGRQDGDLVHRGACLLAPDSQILRAGSQESPPLVVRVK